MFRGKNALPAGRNARRSPRRDDEAAKKSRDAENSCRSRRRAARRRASSSGSLSLAGARVLPSPNDDDETLSMMLRDRAGDNSAGAVGVIAAYSSSHPTGTGDEGRDES